MQFTARLQSSRNELLWLVTGSRNNTPCWYYVIVHKSKLELFKVRLQSASMQLTDYGDILYSGWGEEPPESIREEAEAL